MWRCCLRGFCRLLLPSAVFYLASVSVVSAETDAIAQPVIVIIIDDVGDNYAKGKAVIELPGPLTFAVLPHSPYGAKLAKKAISMGKEVMLHAPMQNTHDRPLGPGALTQDLDKAAFLQTLQANIDSVPGAVGVNNHMGSLLTTLKPQMEWTMEVARDNNFYFVDSGTTAESIAWRVAKEERIPFLRRDVFLDNERTLEFIHQQFEKALEIALKEGHAVAIGHPYPETVQYLQWALPQLDRLGVRLATASSLIEEQQVSTAIVRTNAQ